MVLVRTGTVIGALVACLAGCASPQAGAVPNDMAQVTVDDLAIIFTIQFDQSVDLLPGCTGLVCGQLCVDPQTDKAHCGGCNNACGAGQECVAGVCACTSTSCSGCCTGTTCNPGTADNACGAKGSTCKSCSTKCINGGCSGCAPGASETQPCGNCGSMTRVCDSNGNWGAFGACGGQGACAPNSTQQGSCDPCSHQTCGSNCQWSGCGLNAGAACEYHSGTHTRGCTCRTACGGSALQWCLPSCQWSTSCDCCVSTGCSYCL